MTKKSSVVCHDAIYGQNRISLRCTKAFIQRFKNTPGLGGVEVLEVGSGWYSVVPRTELLNGDSASGVDKLLFLEEARLDLEVLLEQLEIEDVQKNASIRVHMNSGSFIQVNRAMSSAMRTPVKASNWQIHQLEERFNKSSYN